MIVMTLKQYCKIHTQKAVAETLNITQGAVGQMVRGPRNITVIQNADGTVDFIEKKFLNAA